MLARIGLLTRQTRLCRAHPKYLTRSRGEENSRISRNGATDATLRGYPQADGVAPVAP